MSTSEAVIRLQQSVETIRQRITTIQGRMQAIDQRMDDLLLASEQKTDGITQHLETLRAHISQRSNQTRQLYDALTQQLDGFIQHVQGSVHELLDDVGATQQTLQDLHSQSQIHHTELTQQHSAFEQLATQLGQKSDEIRDAVTGQHQQRQPIYHHKLLQTSSAHHQELHNHSQQHRQYLETGVQQQVIDKLDAFVNFAQQAQQQLDQHLQTHGQQLRYTVQNHVEVFTQQDDARRQKLGQETQNLVTGLTNVGHNMSHLTGTLVDGGRNVGDAMQVANVGLNTVIGILKNMKQLMEEIESFA